MNALETDFSRLDAKTRALLDRKPEHFIDGAARAGAVAATIPVVDPSSGKTISAIAAGTAADIDAAVAAAIVFPPNSAAISPNRSACSSTEAGEP